MKKSLKKQAVFPVLMLLVVTALALIGSSFAWFSMANTAKVTTVSGTIEDSSIGLMISQDATNFTSSVTLGDTAKTFVLPYRFHQVSSADGVNFFEAEITAKDSSNLATKIVTTKDVTVVGSNDNTNQLFGTYKNSSDVLTPMTYPNAIYVTQSTGAKANAAGDGVVTNQASYMVFDLFFQVDAASKLYLNNGTSFTQDTNNKAMRVAFLDYSSSAVNADPDAAAAAAVALNTVEQTTIWNPSATADNTTYYGIVKASAGQGPVVETVATDLEIDPYAEVSGYTQTVTTKQSSQLFINGTNFDDSTADSTLTNKDIASLAAGINKLRVVVWLEGNDPSCVTTIAKTAISITLSFYARKVA